jgi:uncharacterized protein (DUF2147 family)
MFANELLAVWVARPTMDALRMALPNEEQMRNLKTVFFLLLAVAVTPRIWADANSILGVWLNGAKDARIDVTKCGENYCGKIVWLKEPNYPEGSKLGTPGTPKLDHNNPDAAQKKVPLMGLEIMKGFQYAGGDSWKDGTIYDPDSGKTYSAKAKLVSPTELDLRGFVGISMFGRTDKWTRVNKE